MTDGSELRGRARAMRREPTPAERTLWRLLKSGRLGGLKFRRQVPMARYIVDFVCFDPRLIIECDGGQHADRSYDAIRDAWLESQGFRVVRLWNGEIMDNLDGVATAILRTVGKG
jgi:very-short-patch-repair endonuclease